jgi:hypothetical protein
MRLFLPFICAPLLAGCATGHAQDWFRSRGSLAENLIGPQLLRYGLNVEQSRCVSDKLGRRLTRTQMRLFQQSAIAVRLPAEVQGMNRLQALRAVASSIDDNLVRLELDDSMSRCNVDASTVAVAAAAPSVEASAGAAPASPEANRIVSGSEAQALFEGRAAVEGAAPGAVPASSARPSNAMWLNLGAAASGQGIAVDAASIEQEESTRTAWFRMIDPGTGPSLTWYRLRVDCSGRTIEPRARRKVDAAGAQLEEEVYPAGYERPSTVETGTVTEIAFLSLCT